MKVIKYQLCTEVDHGTEDEPKIEQVFSTVTLGWSRPTKKLPRQKPTMASIPLRMMVSRSLHPPRLTASRPKWRIRL